MISLNTSAFLIEDFWNDTQIAFLRAYFAWSKDSDQSRKNCLHILQSFAIAIPCRDKKDFITTLYHLGFDNDFTRLEGLYVFIETFTQHIRNNDLETYLRNLSPNVLRE